MQKLTKEQTDAAFRISTAITRATLISLREQVEKITADQPGTTAMFDEIRDAANKAAADTIAEIDDMTVRALLAQYVASTIGSATTNAVKEAVLGGYPPTLYIDAALRRIDNGEAETAWRAKHEAAVS